MAANASEEVQFFVSYTGKDQAWAEWIAWQLEHHGHRTLIQAWDFKSGGVFPGDMHRALQNSARVLAVLTPAYMASGFCQPEWQAAFADDPTGEKGVLVCIRVADFKPDGLLRGRTYIDLVEKSEAEAARHLLERLERGRAKPVAAPSFPGKGPATAPVFPGTTSTTPRTSIPHNLPRLQPFFGREEELRRIAAALDPEDRTWGALIDGPGGMGKTSLAVRAAYDASPERFSRIAFVSLKSRELDDDGVRDLSGFLISGLAELYNELARELGHAEITKAVEDQRPRLLLDALRDTRTLLVLDNLESLTKPERGQIFNFVKRLPQGCKAILTSRGRIGSGAEELILEKLDQEAALQTLAELAKRNPALAKTSEDERIALYTQTGGKPLLLRWTAGQIGRGSCRTFTDAIAYLRSCPPDNDPLEFIFGDLVADFSTAETQALCALTYFNLPAKVEHLAAVAGVPEPELEPALKSLANRSLAVPKEEGQTYTLIPLVADFLRKKKPEVMAETGDRLEQRAYALVVENGYFKYDRFSTLEVAWPTVAAALPRFLAGKYEPLETICDALDSFLAFTGRWDERLAFACDAERCAVLAGNFYLAGWQAYRAGWTYARRRQSSEVLACASRAEAHWLQAKVGNRERSLAFQLRGAGHRAAKDFPAAIVACREAVEFVRIGGLENRDVASILNDLALAESDVGDLDSAERGYREGLRIARTIEDSELIAAITGNLALLALNRKDWPGAETLAREALRISMKVGSLDLIASDSNDLAEALVHQEKRAEALPYARRAMELFAQMGSPKFAEAQAKFRECAAPPSGKG